MDEWVRLWLLYFGVKIERPQEWLDELKERKCDPRDGELVHVVRWMEKRRKASDRRPTLSDLKDAIWAHRDEAKKYAREHESPAGPVDCRLCGGSGLLCFTCETSPAGLVRLATIRLGKAGAPGLTSCPCDCDRGRRMYPCDPRITEAVVALYRRARVSEPKRREVERADLW